MRHIFRTLITIVAALAVVFSGVAFAQEGDPVAECEASGGLWTEDYEGIEGLDLCDPHGHQKIDCAARGEEWVNAYYWGQYCEPDGMPHLQDMNEPEPVAEAEPVEPAQVESATAEPAPSAPLPATEPTPASPRAPQYTG